MINSRSSRGCRSVLTTTAECNEEAFDRQKLLPGRKINVNQKKNIFTVNRETKNSHCKDRNCLIARTWFCYLYKYICICVLHTYLSKPDRDVSYHSLERRTRSMILEGEDKMSHPYDSFVLFCCGVLGCNSTPSTAASVVPLYDNAFLILSIFLSREKPECHR